MAVIDRSTVTTTEPGWFTDPTGLHNLRYYDGHGWTEHVTHFGPTPCPACGAQRAATGAEKA